MSKAKEYIENHRCHSAISQTFDEVNYNAACEAVEIAEQEMKDKAIECHKRGCVKARCQANTTFNTGIGNNSCDGNCEYMEIFKRLINK